MNAADRQIITGLRRYWTAHSSPTRDELNEKCLAAASHIETQAEELRLQTQQIVIQDRHLELNAQRIEDLKRSLRYSARQLADCNESHNQTRSELVAYHRREGRA